MTTHLIKLDSLGRDSIPAPPPKPNSLAAQRNPSPKFRVAPNRVLNNQLIHVELPHYCKAATFELYDLNGRMISAQQVDRPSKMVNGPAPNGVFLYRVIAEVNGDVVSQSGKLVVLAP